MSEQAPRIVIGYAYAFRFRLPDTAVWFPAGSAWRCEVRAFQGAREVLFTLTTENGGLSRFSDRELDVVMSADNTALITTGTVVLDVARSDPTPNEYLGFIARFATWKPVTAGGP